MHVDVAYSGDGDALGLAMGHVSEMVMIDKERKPFITIDLLLRIKAPAGREIFLGDIRKIIYSLKDDRKFNIVKVTTDGFQSTDMRQQLQRRRIMTEVVSVDKDMTPYSDLYDAVMEERIALPPYMTLLNANDTDPIDILFKELTELQEDGPKIDHPPDGSKDVADSVAGVVFTLMGSKAYQRAGFVGELESSSPDSRASDRLYQHPAINSSAINTAMAPVPNEPIPWRPPTRR